MRMDKGIKPGDLTAHRAFLQGIVHMANHHLETQIHVLFFQFFPLGFKLLVCKGLE